MCVCSFHTGHYFSPRSCHFFWFAIIFVAVSYLWRSWQRTTWNLIQNTFWQPCGACNRTLESTIQCRKSRHTTRGQGNVSSVCRYSCFTHMLQLAENKELRDMRNVQFRWILPVMGVVDLKRMQNRESLKMTTKFSRIVVGQSWKTTFVRRSDVTHLWNTHVSLTSGGQN